MIQTPTAARLVARIEHAATIRPAQSEPIWYFETFIWFPCNPLREVSLRRHGRLMSEVECRQRGVPIGSVIGGYSPESLRYEMGLAGLLKGELLGGK